MPVLTEYELERQANIERNQAILQSLGIFQAEVGPSKAKEVRPMKSERRILSHDLFSKLKNGLQPLASGNKGSKLKLKTRPRLRSGIH